MFLVRESKDDDGLWWLIDAAHESLREVFVNCCRKQALIQARVALEETNL